MLIGLSVSSLFVGGWALSSKKKRQAIWQATVIYKSHSVIDLAAYHFIFLMKNSNDIRCVSLDVEVRGYPVVGQEEIIPKVI